MYLSLRFIIVCSMNQYGVNPTYTLTLSCLLEIIFACLFYIDRLIYKIFIGILFTFLCLIADFMPFFFLTIFFDIPSDVLMSSGAIRIPVTALYLTLVAVFVFLFRYLFNEETSASHTQKIIYTIISVLGVSVGHYILATMILSEQFYVQEITTRLAFIALIYMFLLITLLTFIYQLGVSNENNQKLLEFQRLRALEEQEYRNMAAKTTALQEMKHDMANHLHSLELMVDKASVPEIQSYIDDLRATLENSHLFLSTGNMAIDCILSSKLTSAKKADIHTDFSVMLPDYFEMDAVSICSLLGNLWDNAIEACLDIQQYTPEATPSILFYLKPYQDMTIIHIENPFIGERTCTIDGDYPTRKVSHEHGIGLKRIKSIVQKEQGILSIDTQNQIFSVHILIPGKETRQI